MGKVSNAESIMERLGERKAVLAGKRQALIRSLDEINAAIEIEPVDEILSRAREPGQAGAEADAEMAKMLNTLKAKARENPAYKELATKYLDAVKGADGNKIRTLWTDMVARAEAEARKDAEAYGTGMDEDAKRDAIREAVSGMVIPQAEKSVLSQRLIDVELSIQGALNTIDALEKRAGILAESGASAQKDAASLKHVDDLLNGL